MYTEHYRMLMKEFKDNLSTIDCGAIGIHRPNSKPQPKPLSHTKINSKWVINSKWIMNLNVELKTIELLKMI